MQHLIRYAVCHSFSSIIDTSAGSKMDLNIILVQYDREILKVSEFSG